MLLFLVYLSSYVAVICVNAFKEEMMSSNIVTYGVLLIATAVVLGIVYSLMRRTETDEQPTRVIE